jgi:predicted nucleic acid-binding protein
VRAVSDAGPLIHLSWINRLDLLAQLFEEVVVPPAVRDEVLAAPSGTLGLDRVQQAFAGAWLQVIPPAVIPRPERVSEALDKGEADALLLAQQIEADILISDDSSARAEARRRGLSVVGTVGVLSQARDNGLIPEALPLLLELRRLGQWLSEELLRTVQEEESNRSN